MDNNNELAETILSVFTASNKLIKIVETGDVAGWSDEKKAALKKAFDENPGSLATIKNLKSQMDEARNQIKQMNNVPTNSTN